MKKLVLAAVIIETCAVAWQPSLRFVRPSADSAIAAAHSALDELGERPLNLPVLQSGEPCPVSKGSHTTVPRVDYIFCSSCYWFGKGPVYFALGWHDGLSDNAVFSLNRVPYEEHAYRAKTPWVSVPDYSGPILIRGRRLDDKRGSKLRFRFSGSKPNERLKLDAPPPGKDPTHWSFWPSSMYLSGPGCYGVQIDTAQGTDVVIFSTMAPARTPAVFQR